MTILETRTLRWPNEAACASTAARIAERLSTAQAGPTAFITLHGMLGAGKTTFARHLLQSLKVAGRIKSPTYAVVEEYRINDGTSAPLDIFHFDFYRFDDPQEWEDAGFRELFAAPGLKLAEWPEKVGDLLPRADLSLHLTPGDGDRRTARFDAHSALGVALLP